MIPPPILDYAPPPQKKLLRRTTAFIFHYLGGFYALVAISAVIAGFFSHLSVADWLLLPVTATTGIIFLRVNLDADRVVRLWTVRALIAVLVNLGVALSCVGSAFFYSPQEAPDGLVRDFSILFIIPIAALLLALALMLVIILRQTHRESPVPADIQTRP